MDHEYVNSKHCKECKRDYDRRRYAKNREAVKAQSKAYREGNREVIAEREKAYREKNREAIAYYQKAYYSKNRGAILEYQKAYRGENRGARLEYQKAYRGKNREAIAEYQKAYRKAHPDKIRAKGHRRRANLAGVPQDGLVYELDPFCAVCYSTESLTVEHMVPISRGGPDTLGNKATMCQSCNSSKNVKSILDADFTVWLVKRRMT